MVDAAGNEDAEAAAPEPTEGETVETAEAQPGQDDGSEPSDAVPTEASQTG
jgi:hypothetical protein